MINLGNLGVPITQQNKIPTAEMFPVSFNQNTYKHWQVAVNNLRSKAPKLAWQEAIKKFISICERNATFPFHEQQTRNDQIITLLLAARRKVVKFMDEQKVLFALVPTTVTRSVTMTTTGFVLTVDSKARLKDTDLTFLEKMGMRRAGVTYAARWQRSLDKDVSFFIANEGANMEQRWHFGYELTVHLFPSIPGNHTPSTLDLERFVMNILYLPILKAFRPMKGFHRLV